MSMTPELGARRSTHLRWTHEARLWVCLRRSTGPDPCAIRPEILDAGRRTGTSQRLRCALGRERLAKKMRFSREKCLIPRVHDRRFARVQTMD